MVSVRLHGTHVTGHYRSCERCSQRSRGTKGPVARRKVRHDTSTERGLPLQVTKTRHILVEVSGSDFHKELYPNCRTSSVLLRTCLQVWIELGTLDPYTIECTVLPKTSTLLQLMLYSSSRTTRVTLVFPGMSPSVRSSSVSPLHYCICLQPRYTKLLPPSPVFGFLRPPEIFDLSVLCLRGDVRGLLYVETLWN